MKNTCIANQCFRALLPIYIIVLLIFSGQSLSGKNYYFSSTTGDDTRTAAQAQNQSTPWKSIDKLNVYFPSILPGDSILFKRGDVFVGAIRIGKSGTSLLPLVFGAYGTGKNPIISAFQTVTGWNNLGGNVWESAATSCKSTLNMVSVNGVNTPVGRYPNPNATNGGYLTFESSVGSTSITDAQLTATPNWTGAEVVIRKNSWIINRCPITSHVDATITYTDASGYGCYDGWGYFIQNDIRTLDANGEWFLNKSTKKLSMFFSDNNPAGYSVKASVYDTLVLCNSKSFITFKGLDFEGSNAYGFYINAGDHITIRNCNIGFIGKDAVYFPNHSFLNVNGCSFSNINDNVMFGNTASTNAYFGFSTVSNCGLIPGNSGVGDGHNFGVSLQADNCITEFNKVTKMGYIGLLLGGNNTIIQNNYVDSTCLLKDDGSGIYVSGALTTTMSNRIIRKNIVRNSIGNAFGKSSTYFAKANGIYVDGHGNNVVIDSNTVEKASAGGIYLGFYSHDCVIKNNILFNNKYNILIVHNDYTPPAFTFSNNQLVNSVKDNRLFYYNVGSSYTTPLEINQLGAFSGNYFVPNDNDNTAWYSFIVKGTRLTTEGVSTHGIASYDAAIGQVPVSSSPKYTINALVGTNKFVNPSFNSNVSGTSISYTGGTATATWDNTNKINGGSVLVNVNTLSTTQNRLTISFAVGNLTAGKNYVLRFKSLGTSIHKSFDVQLYSGGYATSEFWQDITNSVTNYEIILSPSLTASSGYVYLRFNDVDAPFNIDDFEFYEADVTKTDPSEYIRFEYNPTNEKKTVTFPTAYKNLKGDIFPSSITLLPYQSTLLIKSEGASINHAPVINDQNIQLNENTPNSTNIYNVLATDADNGQTLTYSILSGNSSGAFAINTTTGTLSVANASALNFEVTPSFPLVVKVQDNGTGVLSSQATITVTLTDVNEAPVITNQAFTLAENSANATTVGTLIASDVDAAQTKTFSIVSGNTNNAFAINSSTGVLTVATASALNFEVTPAFSLVIKVQDNGTGALSSQATITVTLTDVNEAPVITNQAFTLAENSANATTVGTLIASDVDAAQTKTFSIVSGNTNNAFAINSSTGVLTVATASALNFEVTPAFSLVVKVQDNGTSALSSQATITVTLTDVNEVPVITNQAFTLAENSANATTIGTLIASDVDAAQTKTFSIVSGNTNNAFAINSSTGVLTVATASALNYEVTPAFSLVVKVQDNGTGALSSQATITVTLTDVNEVPVISDQTFSAFENTINATSVGTVLASDPDAAQSKTFSIISGNTNNAFAINSSTGVLTVTTASALNFEVTPAFSLVVKVQDNGTGALSSQATITVTLININEAPMISNQTFTIAENSALASIVGTVIANDQDAGQILTYSIVSGNTNSAFAINASTGVLTVGVASAVNFEVTPTFTLLVKVQDNGNAALSSQAFITISVNNVNEAPIINNQTFSVTENSANGTSVGIVVASDPDAAQSKAFTIVSGNTNNAFIINASTGELTIGNSAALRLDLYSAFSLNIRVTDNGTGNLYRNALITINLVSGPNQPPMITDQAFTLPQAAPTGTLVGMVSAVDPNVGQVLQYSILSGNTDGTFTINTTTGEIIVSSTAGLKTKTGSVFSLVVKVQDNGTGNLSSQALVTVTLVDVNEAPVIENQTFLVSENSSNLLQVGVVLASDPNPGQILSYSILSGNTGNTFSLDATSGTLTVADEGMLDFEAMESFKLVVKVQDNGIGNLSNEATVTITVVDKNEMPVINNQTFGITENPVNGSIIGTIEASDPDSGQTKIFSILSGNPDGAFGLDPSTGVLSVAKNTILDYEMMSEVTLVVGVQDNGQGNLSNEATISIQLIDINEAPAIENQFLNVVENSAPGTEIGTLQATDPDKGQGLKFSIVAGNENQAFQLNSTTGVLTVADSSQLNYGRNPMIVLTVKVQDSGVDSLSAISIVTINVQPGPKDLTYVSELLRDSDISVYPNPTASMVNIDLGNVSDQTVNIKIFDMHGKQIFSSDSIGEKKVGINMENKQPGTYLASISTKDQTLTKRIIVSNNQ